MDSQNDEHYADRMVGLGEAKSRPWLLPSLTVGAGLVGWLLSMQVLHGGGSVDPLRQLMTLALAVLALALCCWFLYRWRQQRRSGVHARHRVDDSKSPLTYRKVRRRSAAVFAATAPVALLVAVLAGPSPWMGLIFAVAIGVPQVIIWLRFLGWSGKALPGSGYSRH